MLSWKLCTGMSAEDIRKMDATASAYAKRDRSAADQFIGNACGYVSLLSQHVHKENNVLFPMADRVIPEEEQNHLINGFDKVETEIIGDGNHERFHRMLDPLKSECLK